MALNILTIRAARATTTTTTITTSTTAATTTTTSVLQVFIRLLQVAHFRLTLMKRMRLQNELFDTLIRTILGAHFRQGWHEERWKRMWKFDFAQALLVFEECVFMFSSQEIRSYVLGQPFM